MDLTSRLDVLCFSHLRWDFVYQRPQHLMSRFARDGRLFFIEEPIFGASDVYMDVSDRGGNVFVCVPHYPQGAELSDQSMAGLVASLVETRGIENYATWFYTPMMLDWASKLDPSVVIYDCMDELKNFKNAPPQLHDRERRLFEMADLVFTGGQSLYEAKRDQHHSVHAFPSSIDAKHFGTAHDIHEDTADQATIPHPRVGFVGVIDERSDISLLRQIAELRPEWSFVMVGPVVKIDPADLPHTDNIYYLGQRSYDELPSILAGWDAAMMPFALNESTKYISPTKTPEYLAAGLPVVSTAITDVIRPYGDLGLVHIAHTANEFVSALEEAMHEDHPKRHAGVAKFLEQHSWDKTYSEMRALILDALRGKETSRTRTV